MISETHETQIGINWLIGIKKKKKLIPRMINLKRHHLEEKVSLEMELMFV